MTVHRYADLVLQLLLQHSNVDDRTGPFRYGFVVAKFRQFHHRKGAGPGDVNFGLFTTLRDQLLGTFYYVPERAGTDELGIGVRQSYPRAYLNQLVEPFLLLVLVVVKHRIPAPWEQRR